MILNGYSPQYFTLTLATEMPYYCSLWPRCLRTMANIIPLRAERRTLKGFLSLSLAFAKAVE